MSLLFDPTAQKGSQTILMDNNEEVSNLHKNPNFALCAEREI
jgi:hypothetical protein